MNGTNKSYTTIDHLNVSKVGIIIKKDDLRASRYAERLDTWLQSRAIATSRDIITDDLDLLIILGGDGTLLHIAEKAARYSIPVAGINLGNLGFLTEFTEDEAEQALARILNGPIPIENRLMLKTRLLRDNTKQPYTYALNEVVINKNTLDRLLHLAAYASGNYITTYKADGLIFSTPTGSTAYNLSAGGPLVHPGLDTILVTPICPFMLSSRPIILPATTDITTVFEGNDNADCAQVIVDGKQHWEMRAGDTLEIEVAEHPLLLIASPARDYFTILRNKLHWGSQDN
ncbi:NAD(+)/NADH kinase [Desulfopila sp. IMCC35008]|uniref:NAD(+)/NADH kinase n=1 Tax=Desulfopila sp. IMCC35008 TaxID=2653858 RepID=UPI0013D808EF|nr:NAD(+)/NADH kinase [Desulfopila sp. IMCC35008]